ncbi:heterokaryon incompatibility protein-domain-containing protein [Boeremia exigua]|uniref:heterokaryon incompatibility protein-domain-containing protein n=1 Tax=Boeremia exigua TaxID=749465 RepID=UPI001E8E8C43|nr:heterokaryon incompatibility protein-domain-containing protein [Boeremia exigua]KAH6622246.1 heterokaryon incompatibility protein-domain-containing protein [Boeremia exigua]
MNAKRQKTKHDDDSDNKTSQEPELLQPSPLIPQVSTTALENSSHAPPYTAINSEQELSIQNAILDGQPVSITENLDCALRHLRYKVMPRTLWVDALSMDQSNIQERNHQVQMMGKIYSTAKIVIVWLGPVDNSDLHLRTVLAAMQLQFSNPTPSIATLFDYLSDIIAILNEQADCAQDSKECALNAISRIIDRSWFQRVWVVQELALSRAASVRIGAYTFHWEPFQQFINWLPHHRVKPDIHSKFCEMASRVRRASTKSSFSSQLCRTLHLSATDPRDKIFSLLGISRTVDMRITTGMLLRQNDLLIYQYAPLHALREDPHSKSLGTLPSWVPDLRITGAAFADSIFEIVTRPKAVDTYHRPLTMITGFNTDPITVQMWSMSYWCSISMTVISWSPTNADTMTTSGLYIGTIAKTSGLLLDSLEDVDPYSGLFKNLYKIYKDIVAPYGGRLMDLVRALGGTSLERSQTDVFRNARFICWLVEELEADTVSPTSMPNPFQKEVDQFNASMAATAKNRVIFVTTGGTVGLSYHPDPNGIRPGDELVGLFGVNFPFVLRRNTDGVTWQMINVAGFRGHEWGHNFLDGTEEITPAILQKHGMKRYTIT